MKNKPNLFVIGASKCGTTFLHHILGQHPEINMSTTKEPYFFTEDNYKDKMEWYDSLFNQKENRKVTGESTPMYSETTCFPEIAKRIHTFNSDSKIIYIVREPFSRLKSVYTQTMSTGHWYKKKHYNQLMPKEFNRAVFEYPPYLEATKYWTHIQNYRKFFNDKKIKIIFFEELTKNYTKTMEEIFLFLEVDPTYISSQKNSNKNTSQGKKVHSPYYSKISKMTPNVIKKIIPVGLKNLIKNTKPPIADPLTKNNVEKIRNELTEEIKQLYNYLDIKDDPWHFFRKEN